MHFTYLDTLRAVLDNQPLEHLTALHESIASMSARVANLEFEHQALVEQNESAHLDRMELAVEIERSEKAQSDLAKQTAQLNSLKGLISLHKFIVSLIDFHCRIPCKARFNVPMDSDLCEQ